MATENKNVLGREGTEAQLRTRLSAGQMGKATDNNKLVHKSRVLDTGVNIVTTFLSEAETLSLINSGGNGSIYWGDPVENFVDLPGGDPFGTVRLVTSERALYTINIVNNWQPFEGEALGQGIVRGGAGEIKLGPHYLSMASSGVYSGGLLTVSGPIDTNVNIGVCEGFIIDTATFGIDTIITSVVSVTSPIVFTPTNIATQNVTYVGLNSSGTQVEWNTLPTPEQRRDNIFLGVAIHSNRTTVEFVNNLQDVSSDITGQLHDLSRYLGYFNIEGNGVTANGANLNFNKAIGTAFKTGVNFEANPKDPDTNYLPAKVTSSFRYRTQTGGEGSAITLIDPTNYDVGGTITAIAGSNNQSTIQKIYVFASNEIRIQYGQTLYSSFSDAVSAVGKEPFVTESNIHENGLLLCSLVVKKGATDLSNTADALFFQAGRFGETGSVGSTATGTLQSGYDNSINPEILTNATLGALTLKNGQALDTEKVLEVANIAGTVMASVDGNGEATLNALEVVGAGTFGDSVIVQDILASKAGLIVRDNVSGASRIELSDGVNRQAYIQSTASAFQIVSDDVANIDLVSDMLSIQPKDNVTAPILELRSLKNGTWTVGEIKSAINFYSADGSGGGEGNHNWIRSVAEETLGRDTALVFGVTTNGGEAIEGMRLNHEGNLLLTNQILQGTVTDTGEGIVCESLKSEANTESASYSITALNTAPSSATDTGVLGEIRYTADYMYVCTATNTWKRSALATW